MCTSQPGMTVKLKLELTPILKASLIDSFQKCWHCPWSISLLSRGWEPSSSLSRNDNAVAQRECEARSAHHHETHSRDTCIALKRGVGVVAYTSPSLQRQYKPIKPGEWQGAPFTMQAKQNKGNQSKHSRRDFRRPRQNIRAGHNLRQGWQRLLLLFFGSRGIKLWLRALVQGFFLGKTKDRLLFRINLTKTQALVCLSCELAIYIYIYTVCNKVPFSMFSASRPPTHPSSKFCSSNSSILVSSCRLLCLFVCLFL